MSPEKKERPTRAHEHTFAIKATPAAVWRAITEAERLTQWFPPQAEVIPGVGGRIDYRWAPEMSNPCVINIWEPEKHLRTSWMEPGGETSGQGKVASVVDWYIDSAGGRTTLRLVHSGFGRGDAWDEEYDGTNRGWEFELRSLRHYLEHHAGRRRTLTTLRQAVTLPPQDVWQRLMGDDGLAAELPEGLHEHAPYRLRQAGGLALEGTVLMAGPPLDFAGTVSGLNQALLRFACESCFGQPEAILFLSTWDVEPAAVDGLEKDLRGMLHRLFADAG